MTRGNRRLETGRVGDLGRARQTQSQGGPMSRLAEILYIVSARRIRPRAIDRYIDYFGDPGARTAMTTIRQSVPDSPALFSSRSAPLRHDPHRPAGHALHVR